MEFHKSSPSNNVQVLPQLPQPTIVVSSTDSNTNLSDTSNQADQITQMLQENVTTSMLVSTEPEDISQQVGGQTAQNALFNAPSVGTGTGTNELMSDNGTIEITTNHAANLVQMPIQESQSIQQMKLHETQNHVDPSGQTAEQTVAVDLSNANYQQSNEAAANDAAVHSTSNEIHEPNS